MPQISDSLIWSLDDYSEWVQNALNSLKKLKASFKSEDDLVLRAECISELRNNSLNIRGLLSHVESADISGSMSVIDGGDALEQ